MRETMDPMTAGESSEKENFANRKLIRPTLPRVENDGNHNSAAPQSGERRDRTGTVLGADGVDGGLPVRAIRCGQCLHGCPWCRPR